jgi:uncharacterized protein (TIGR03083 family)
MTTPPFADLLTLIADRSAALRAAAGGTDADARVPGCPDWSVRDLVAHLGEVQRFWAAAVMAGPATEAPADDQVVDRTPSGELLPWFASSTETLLSALREAGPDRGCWAWWQASGAPLTAGAIARHQVQEAAVHARDAQEAAGRPEPLPNVVAADGVDEFLAVMLASEGPWPHAPATVAMDAGAAGSWLVELGEAGAVSTRADSRSSDGARPDTRLRGSAGDLVLVLYGRLPLDAVQVEGDRELAGRLLAWPGLE